jgi:hypothetical protein
VLGELAGFGTDWLHVLVPIGFLAGALLWLATRSELPRSAPSVAHLGAGAERVTGLPSWVAAPLAILYLGSLPIAVAGFFWDVAWHIDTGRDEFLLSPPHLALLTGVTLIGVAGLVSTALANREDAEIGWAVRGRRIPYGAAAMLIAGGAATVGWGIDELWHAAYGLDLSMWSPPHLLMIASAAFMPLAAWLLFAEAGPEAGHRWVRRYLPAWLAIAGLIGLSAFQLEFDLGVPQWQTLYHPVLIALAAGVALTAGRAALGRGGALVVAVGFVAFRLGLLVLTTGVWGLSAPLFPLYIGAAIAVELAFAVLRERSPVAVGLGSGIGIATFGLAAEWSWSLVGQHHPWTTGLLPGIAIAGAAAIAGAVLGTALGRVLGHQEPAIGGLPAGAAIAVAVLTIVLPLPRTVPEAEVTLRTTAVGTDAVLVTVELDPPDAVERPDRFEVMAWQGGGRILAALVPIGTPGTYAVEEPVPVHGGWKTLVRLAARDHLAAVPIRLPADPEIGASAVPVEAERTVPFVDEPTVLQREAREGPRWPSMVAYAGLAASTTGVVAALVGGAAGMARRRREAGNADQPAPVMAGSAAADDQEG